MEQHATRAPGAGLQRLAIGGLALLALAELGVGVWQRQRTEALLGRMVDVQTLSALDLDSRLGLILLLDEEAAGLSYDDLRAMQAAGAAWLEAYAARHGLEAQQHEMLRGVLARYLADVAGERLAHAVRSPDAPPPTREAEQTRRFFRAAAHILGSEAATSTFEAEIRAAWDGWMR